ncbi:binary toxin-like calcium binding domain-containing protein [Bacillus cereus group sp. BfR-BA-01538]|uniref:binary toxin-like calcium binding domain-containing protein n=1 Tax=Bacillus cereus group sp. BfR-BA-01538 TaxID=2920373 RepID=UPI001F59AA95
MTQNQSSTAISTRLIGYYFNDLYFSNFAMMEVTENIGDYTLKKSQVTPLLSEEKQNIKSARWVGTINPDEDGEYKFSTSSDQDVIMSIDDTIVINQGPMEKSISLKKGTSYELCIEYQGCKVTSSENIVEFQLFYATDKKGKRIVTDNFVQLPDISLNHSRKTPLIPQRSLFERFSKKKEDVSLYNSKLTVDSDGDGIADSLETGGYTADPKNPLKATAWTEELGNLGYKKYISNPLRANTARDPYTDLEKLWGSVYLPAATNREAYNPLVAAIPAVRVEMERLQIIQLNSIGQSVGQTQSESASTSNTKSSEWNVSASYTTPDITHPFGSATVTGSYGQSSSSTSTFENSTGRNWDQTLNWDSGNSARLNANIRYYNTGTAPIYDVAPTINFVMMKGNSIRTLRSGQDLQAKSLTPGSTYPIQSQAPISLDRQDDFESNVFAIDINTLRQLEADGALNIETPQVSGTYVKVDGSGTEYPAGDYSQSIASVKQNAAHIVFSTAAGRTIDRYVATKNKADVTDATPVITLGEALKAAFGAEERNGTLYIGDIPINSDNVDVIFDYPTGNEFKNQFATPGQEQNIFKLKLWTLETSPEEGRDKIPMSIVIKQRRQVEGIANNSTYSIRTAFNDNYCIANANNNQVKMLPQENNAAKTLNVSYNTQKNAYTLRFPGTNYALSVESGTGSSTNRFCVAPYNANDEKQYWIIETFKKGSYSIRNFVDGTRIGDIQYIIYQSEIPNADVITYPRKEVSTSINQNWLFKNPTTAPSMIPAPVGTTIKEGHKGGKLQFEDVIGFSNVLGVQFDSINISPVVIKSYKLVANGVVKGDNYQATQVNGKMEINWYKQNGVALRYDSLIQLYVLDVFGRETLVLEEPTMSPT